jgi:hypothetical protein
MKFIEEKSWEKFKKIVEEEREKNFSLFRNGLEALAWSILLWFLTMIIIPRLLEVESSLAISIRRIAIYVLICSFVVFVTLSVYYLGKFNGLNKIRRTYKK